MKEAVENRGIAYDHRASAPMSAIVRVAVVAVTLALFVSALFNALLGFQDIAIVLALATPLGISAWGFSRAGHNEAAVGLLCSVLIVVVTLILLMNPLGVHDMSITAYGGIVLVAALLLTRRAFFAIVALVFIVVAAIYIIEPANSLPSFVPGRVHSTGHHPLRAAGSLVIGIVFSVGAGFVQT